MAKHDTDPPLRKVQVARKCFIDNRRVQPGEVVEVRLAELPEWMREVEPDAPVHKPRSGRKPPPTEPDDAPAADAPVA